MNCYVYTNDNETLQFNGQHIYIYQHTLVGVESDGWLLSSTVS